MKVGDVGGWRGETETEWTGTVTFGRTSKTLNGSNNGGVSEMGTRRKTVQKFTDRAGTLV